MERVYCISASLNEREFLEICGLCWGADRAGFGNNNDSLFAALRKIKSVCEPLCSPEMLDNLERVTDAIEAAFNTPSVERGMLQGGLQGITETVLNSLPE